MINDPFPALPAATRDLIRSAIIRAVRSASVAAFPKGVPDDDGINIADAALVDFPLIQEAAPIPECTVQATTIHLVAPGDGWSPPVTDRLYTDGNLYLRIRFTADGGFGAASVAMTAALSDANGWVATDASGECIFPISYTAAGQSADELAYNVNEVVARMMLDATQASAAQQWLATFANPV